MVEKVKYTILKNIDGIELRKYPKLILAVVENNDENNEFGLLFNYISGNNKTQKKIPMTSPVITSEKIKMTAPVISKNNYMAFIMPSDYDKDNIPIPQNPNVAIKTQKEKIYAVIKFGGYATNPKIESNKAKLINMLESQKIKIVGDPVLMRYNSPFAPGFIRKNEIAIEIEYR
jgi:hypothetical protein